MRRGVPVLLVVLALAGTPLVAAHFDVPVGDASGQSFELGPGESRSFPLDLHYHRVFGRVVADGAPVVVEIVRDEGSSATTGASAGATFWRSSPFVGEAGLNVLVDCCDDASYSPFRLVVAHAGDAAAPPAQVQLVAKATHDDLLVGTTLAEGDVFQNAGIFWLIGGILGWRLFRATRGGARAATGADARPATQLLARAAIVAAVPLVVLALAAAWGVARYGGGATAGVIATFGAVFPSFGGVVLMLGLTAAWTYAIVLWLHAHRAAQDAGGRAARVVAAGGAAFALVIAAAPFSLVPEYGPRVLVAGPLFALPFVLVLVAGAAHLAWARSAVGDAEEERAPM